MFKSEEFLNTGRLIYEKYCFQESSTLNLARTWVSEHFSAETAHFKSKNLIQFWNRASPEYLNILYVHFFFIMNILRSWS